VEGKEEEEEEEVVVVVVEEELVCADEDTGITCGRNGLELPPFDDQRHCTIGRNIDRLF
jgi:hypothetical protein